MTRDELIAELQRFPENVRVIQTDDGVWCDVDMLGKDDNGFIRIYSGLRVEEANRPE